MIQVATEPDALLGWLECLADPVRLRLLRLLEGQELGVGDLCDVLQLPQSTASRHLKVLGDQGWLRSRRQGTNNLYRMTVGELDDAARRLWALARERTLAWAACRQDRLRLDRILRERQDEGQAFFEGAARQWDKLREELYGQAFTAAALAALMPADFVVADLGCGTGPMLALLAPHVKQVIGVDASAAMLEAARRRLGEEGRASGDESKVVNREAASSQACNVDLRRGDLSAVPIDDGTCDAVLLVLALTYVADPRGALAEGRRILKPGGKVVVIDLLLHDRDDFRRQLGQQAMGFELKQMMEWMTEAGFEDATCRPLSPEARAKGPALFLCSGSTSCSTGRTVL